MEVNSLVLKVYNELKFRVFEYSINSNIWSNHQLIYNWANNLAESSSEIVEEPYSKGIRKALLESYFLKYGFNSKMSFLIHLPFKNVSPGGYSVFNNLIEALNYVGIKAKSFSSYSEFTERFLSETPSVILASDYTESVNTINWELIKSLKERSKLLVGLTASAEDDENDLPLLQRLDRAKNNNVNFFFAFKSPEYTNSHLSFVNFHRLGYKIINFEFGANPLYHFPIKLDFKRDINFVFLASSNSDKRPRYYKWLKKLFTKYDGFIDGPGWHQINNISPSETHKFLYARAKIGINLHIDNSIDFQSELNERTYILAACGIPQLIDNPKLLNFRFSKDAMFSADNPTEYLNTFEFMLLNQTECMNRVQNAFKEVYDNHTIFHRIDHLMMELNNCQNNI